MPYLPFLSSHVHIVGRVTAGKKGGEKKKVSVTAYCKVAMPFGSRWNEEGRVQLKAIYFFPSSVNSVRRICGKGQEPEILREFHRTSIASKSNRSDPRIGFTSFGASQIGTQGMLSRHCLEVAVSSFQAASSIKQGHP